MRERRVRAMRPIVAGAFLAAALVVQGVAPARACSCVRTDDRPMADVVAQADGAFVGTLVRVGRPSLVERFFAYQPEVPHRFEVEAVAAGRIGREVEVRAGTNPSGCGLSLQRGERVGLLVHRRDDRWEAGLCGQVDADALAAVAGAPDPSVRAPFDALLPAGVAGAAALAAVVVALARTGARTRNDPAPS